MSVWQAVLLGVVQGITEFLPISSSGHLVLVESLLGLHVESLLWFDVIVHSGTLVALLVFFRKDLWDMLKALLSHFSDVFSGKAGLFVKKHPEDPLSQLWFLVVATVPIVLLAPFLKDVIEQYFRDPNIVMGMLALTAFFLALAEVLGKKNLAGITKVKTAFVMGMFQVLAVIPGVSRSGSTIVGGLLGGLDRQAAARFAFLMAVPAIGGATVFLVKDFFDPEAGIQAVSTAALTAGFLSSMIASFVCMYGMLAFLRRRSLWWFVGYLVLVNAWFLLS